MRDSLVRWIVALATFLVIVSLIAVGWTLHNYSGESVLPMVITPQVDIVVVGLLTNGEVEWFALDTGSTLSYNMVPGPLCVGSRCVQATLVDDYVKSQLKVMHLADPTHSTQGLIGQDLLKQFKEVRLDYINHTVKFEEK